jgi:hypothetical protein
MMLVYGDHACEEKPVEALRRLKGDLATIWATAEGIARHGALVAAFIEAGELGQGLSDFEFMERKADARSAMSNTAMRLLIALAQSVARSWSSGFSDLGPIPLSSVEQLQAVELPEIVQISLPEGYAFYALYPESYMTAAKALMFGSVKIVGLRSIGTSLAAAVAGGVGADGAVTVRPRGHPFDRRLALTRSLQHELLAARNAAFAIVDEGPGLSGSSFGCVADFLEDRGVEPRRMHFFPSHAGDLGPEASPRHRQRWATAQRHVLAFEQLVGRSLDPRHRLERWVEDIVGSPVQPLLDISAGAWRKHLHGEERQWPPANPQQERRKFLLRSSAGAWLLKFAGLGRYGAEKLALARVLADAGLTPPVADFRHGFLVERWLEDARPLDPNTHDRAQLVEHLGRYLGFRARHAPASRPGASLDALWTMAVRNSGLALGDDATRALDRWKTQLPGLTRHLHPIRGDNRLHTWEWLVVAGRLIKTDALDHHSAHDLIGCQDLAWDIAGATIEFALTPDERDRLCAIAEQEAARLLVPELIQFLATAYLAFQVGSYTLAAQANAHDLGERSRLRAEAGRYSDALRRTLTGEPAIVPGTPRALALPCWA